MPDSLHHRRDRHTSRSDPYDSDSGTYQGSDRRRARSLSYDHGDRVRSRYYSPRRSTRQSRRSDSVERNQHRSRGDERRSYHDEIRPRQKDYHRSRSEERLRHATTAAFDAAAMEALRVRHEPGKWTGRKGARVATAALGAAAVDMTIDQNPKKHEMRKLLGSALGGLIANRLANGKRDELRHHH